MKKTFNYLLLLFTAITLSCGFAACSDDDDDEGGKSSIVGTWEYSDEDFGLTLTFNKNGTVVIYEEYYDDSYPWGDEVEEGKYEVEGTTLYVYFGDECEEYEIISVSSSKLTLEDEYGDRMTFRRV